MLAAALILAAPAMAKTDPQVVALKKQVAALRVTVGQLRTDVDKNRQLAICYYALTQDSFRTAFIALSKLTQAITGNPVTAWEQIPRLDDQGACAAVGLPRP